MLLATGSSWTGPLSWRKPATFGVSFGLISAVLTWVVSLVEVPTRVRTNVLAALTVACVLEVTVITVQTWRGQPSHFGVTGPGAPVIAGAAVGGFGLLTVATAVAAVLVLRAPGWSPSFLLALRVGFAWLLISFGLGVYMLVRGMMISRLDGDVTGAFAFSATVKPAHATTFAGILVLPALAGMLSATRRTEVFRMRVVRLACSATASSARSWSSRHSSAPPADRHPPARVESDGSVDVVDGQAQALAAEVGRSFPGRRVRPARCACVTLPVGRGRWRRGCRRPGGGG